MVVRDGRTLAQPFLDIRGERRRPAGSRACCRWRSRPTTPTSGASTSTSPPATATSARGVPRARAPTALTRPDARSCSAMHDPESNHNGGPLLFGPDGFLYVGMGDGGGGGDPRAAATARTWARCSARSCGSTRGLRRQAVLGPRSNPFVGRRGARGEIYAYGLRNPWRFSFDRAPATSSIADVGQDAGRGGRLRAAGPRRARTSAGARSRAAAGHAPRARAGAMPPVIKHTHGAGRAARSPAVTSCATRGSRSLPAATCTATSARARIRDGDAAHHGDGQRPGGAGCRGSRLSSFGEDAQGRIYAALARPARSTAWRRAEPLASGGGAGARRARRRPRPRRQPRAVHARAARTRGSWAAIRAGSWTRARTNAAHIERGASRRGPARGGIAGHRADPRPRRPLGAPSRRCRGLGGVPTVAAAGSPAPTRAWATATRSDRCWSWPTPGHAPDHLAFVAGRALFSGDAVLGRGERLRRAGPRRALGVPARPSERLAAMDLAVICPGTGPLRAGPAPPSSPSTASTGWTASAASSRRSGRGSREVEELLDSGLVRCALGPARPPPPSRSPPTWTSWRRRAGCPKASSGPQLSGFGQV